MNQDQESKEKAEGEEEEAASEEEVIYEEEEEEEDFINDEELDIPEVEIAKKDAEENRHEEIETLKKMKVDLLDALHKEYICKECVSAQLDVINAFEEGTFPEQPSAGLETVSAIMENVIQEATKRRRIE